MALPLDAANARSEGPQRSNSARLGRSGRSTSLRYRRSLNARTSACSVRPDLSEVTSADSYPGPTRRRRRLRRPRGHRQGVWCYGRLVPTAEQPANRNACQSADRSSEMRHSFARYVGDDRIATVCRRLSILDLCTNILRCKSLERSALVSSATMASAHGSQSPVHRLHQPSLYPQPAIGLESGHRDLTRVVGRARSLRPPVGTIYHRCDDAN